MKVTILPKEYTGDPEAVAMLQAFYSRSLQPIDERLHDLGDDLEKVKKALKTYYIGYGHSSIAQCGFVTIFVEGVSLWAAKVIQSWPLYNGQESSTRYIDFANAEVVASSAECRQRQQDALQKYTQTQKEVEAALHRKFTCPTHVSTSQFDKAVKARSFDIARGWLPWGVTTNLSWTTSLRDLNEHLADIMAHHDVPEIHLLVREIYAQVVKNFPSSVWPWERLYDESKKILCLRLSNQEVFEHVKQPSPKYTGLPINQPISKGSKLSDEFNLVVVDLRGYLDFGSWRDLQRHRTLRGLHTAFLQPTGKTATLHSWYSETAEDLGIKGIESYTDDTVYSRLLAHQVSFIYSVGLGHAVYIAQLRSAITVHPTLRKVAMDFGSYLIGCGCPVEFETQPATYAPVIERGAQDIVQVSASN